MDRPTSPAEVEPCPSTENNAAKKIIRLPTVSSRTANHLNKKIKIDKNKED